MSTLRETTPGLYGSLRFTSAEITFADTIVELEDLAAGYVVIECWAEVSTPFNAGTTNVLTLGDGTDGDKYLAAADVDEGSAGVSPTAGPFAAETTAGTLTATYAQTGGAATAGAATVCVLYSDAPA